MDMSAGGELSNAVVHGDEDTGDLASFARRAGLDPRTLMETRVAVLSLGSNASPEQLSLKFSGMTKPVFIPVLRGFLVDHDVVYSAHITRYGSVPAALASSPGSEVQIFVNLLDKSQLDAMHRTESLGRNYNFSYLKGIDLRLEGGGVINDVYFYRSRYGLLIDGGSPIALAAIPARRRAYPSMNEAEVLEWVRQRLAPDLSLDDFIAANIASPERRAGYIEALAAFSSPTEFEYQDILG